MLTSLIRWDCCGPSEQPPDKTWDTVIILTCIFLELEAGEPEGNTERNTENMKKTAQSKVCTGVILVLKRLRNNQLRFFLLLYTLLCANMFVPDTLIDAINLVINFSFCFFFTGLVHINGH